VSEISKVLQNRYEIKSLLGQGGMGAIFEGIDLKLGGSRVAIKQALLTSDSARRAFEREAICSPNYRTLICLKSAIILPKAMITIL
jgi:serine/threonine protein kinase